MNPDPLNEALDAGSFRRRRVAILLFDDVEVLDFAGPFEVFGVAETATGEPAFEVVTVALHPGRIVARNGLCIVPSCTASELRDANIVVVPGGVGTRRELHNPAMLDFIRAASGTAELTLSVCTGALLLGAAGLLEGHAATTHYSAMDALRALASGAEILPDSRIVDNGALITSAGVSAGIDAALYVVSRFVGDAQAEAAARYMQYDWRCRCAEGVSVMRGGA
ncbi:MAG TPA: DJ-1/PfpI family protein [Allosphingosinicella sp.]|jgi:transcriptional regulator GlxA family with amidase domain